MYIQLYLYICWWYINAYIYIYIYIDILLDMYIWTNLGETQVWNSFWSRIPGPGGTLLLGTLWRMRSLCTDLRAFVDCAVGKVTGTSSMGKPWENGGLMGLYGIYTLVNVYITMFFFFGGGNPLLIATFNRLIASLPEDIINRFN